MEKYMEDAFKEARKALSVGEVPVGCVFIYKDEIIAAGGNEVNKTKNATRHAEFVCIDQVYDYCEKHNLDYKEVFLEITVVVTVEPCIMCSAALHEFRVKEIIFGCTNDRFGGKSVLDVSEELKIYIPIRGGFRADEEMALLKDFYKQENPSAPESKRRKKT